jgi:oligosaccharide repeat unit polymerase
VQLQLAKVQGGDNVPALRGATPDKMHFPPFFFLLVALIAGLLLETWFRRREPWAVPASAVYITTLVWYFADLQITPENYEFIPDSLLTLSYAQVAEFIVAYRIIVPWIARWFIKNAAIYPLNSPSVEKLLGGAIIVWVGLLSYGVVRMGGDLFGTLFPLEGRASANMWSRGAAGDAGPSGFLVSSASYLYVLVCASFGILLFFVKSVHARILCLILILVTWPFFLLLGTRNLFLAVFVPSAFALLLFGRQPIWIKLVCLAAGLIFLNAAFLRVISFRNVGFNEYLAEEESGELNDLDMRHQGLNMIQELCFVNVYTSDNKITYGARYTGELLNVIPRAIWPGKPLLGVDYAIWRGFSGGESDIGVVATISTGFIGGGILNFGPFFGPLAVALLIASWTGLLARWWEQRASLLRCCLFLTGLGETFNLGRDITLLVLWPIVFGYFVTRFVEYLMGPRPTSREVPALQSTAADIINAWTPIAQSRPESPRR